MKRIILAGGSGFLGRMLTRHFRHLGWEVVVLSRWLHPPPNEAIVETWDGVNLGDWRRELDQASAVINLAGRSVDCRYHARNRRLILDSRVNSTRALGKAIAQCQHPPGVWLNASTATIYKHSLDRAMDEQTGEIGATREAKDAFSVEVAQAWEQAFREVHAPDTRKVTLRSAMVLGNGQNSVFPVLRRLVKLGLGGPMAGGRQYVSWIHEMDFCRAVAWLIDHEDFHGAVNLAAPHPLPNSEMMKRLRQACRVRWGLPAPRWLLELGAFLLRTETELIIKSRRVVPGRLLEAGFAFHFPDLKRALEDLCHRRPSAPSQRPPAKTEARNRAKLETPQAI